MKIQKKKKKPYTWNDVKSGDVISIKFEGDFKPFDVILMSPSGAMKFLLEDYTENCCGIPRCVYYIESQELWVIDDSEYIVDAIYKNAQLVIEEE